MCFFVYFADGSNPRKRETRAETDVGRQRDDTRERGDGRKVDSGKEISFGFFYLYCMSATTVWGCSVFSLLPECAFNQTKARSNSFCLMYV